MPDVPVRFFDFGPFRFDVRNRVLLRDGRPVPLGQRATDVLVVLLEGGGDLVTKEQIQERVWGRREQFVSDSALTFQIHKLREALRSGGGGQEYLKTVSGHGFRLAVPVVAVRPNDEHITGREVADAPPSLADIEAEPHRSPATLPASGPTLANLATAAPHEALPPRARSARRSVVWSIAGATALVAFVGAAAVGLALRVKSGPPVQVAHYAPLTADRQLKTAVGPLVTDGARVFFQLGHITRAAASVGVNGGAVAPTNTGVTNGVIVDASATRGEYLTINGQNHSGEGQLWIVPMSGDPPRRVGSVTCRSAAWSPDGAWIAYTAGRHLHVVASDGTRDQRVATVSGQPMWPRWSPDGRRLRFTVESRFDQTMVTKLWEVGVDGTGLRRLLPDDPEHPESNECCGTWTPDGEFFVFQRSGEWPEPPDLWALPESSPLFGNTTRGAYRLTSGLLSFSNPAASADGERLYALGVQRWGELVRYDPAVRDFVPYLRGMPVIWVSFSRDGERVAYVQHPEGTLWQARSDGSEPRQLTFAPMVADGCTWSPDGRWIAFRARTPGTRMKIHLIPADGGAPTPIIPEDQEQGIPSWSADGRQLVFGEVPPVWGQPSGQVLRLYDIERREFSNVPGSTNLWTPRWSPDGRYISALTIVGQQLRLYDVATGTWHAHEADHINSPTWSRDSRYLYYDTEGTMRRLRRVRVPDGPVEDLVDLDQYPTVTYWWSGLALDDSPIILRSLGSVEVYALDLERR